MALIRRARDSRLLDSVEALPVEAFSGRVWRVVREGRDPLACSASGGRWDDQSFDVLYTSTHADGAVAELHFHLSAGQPVFPSKSHYVLFEIRLTLTNCLRINSLSDLAVLGVRTPHFGQLSYSERRSEYPRSQEVAEAAFFHGRDGMIVPSARGEHPSVVVFCRHVGAAGMEVVGEGLPLDWTSAR